MEPLTQSAGTTSFKRSTAVKIRLTDLNRGKWMEKYLELLNGDSISRARVMATVVSKFVSDDSKFASLILDDSTDTIRAKTWDSVKLLEPINIGDITDLIGKVKYYNEEIYLVPDIIKRVEDPNMELLRRLELIKKFGPENPNKKQEEKTAATSDLRKQTMSLIEESKDGISYLEILQKIKAPQAEIESILNDFLSGGLCYEPNPGVIKKI